MYRYTMLTNTNRRVDILHKKLFPMYDTHVFLNNSFNRQSEIYEIEKLNKMNERRFMINFLFILYLLQDNALSEQRYSNWNPSILSHLHFLKLRMMYKGF